MGAAGRGRARFPLGQVELTPASGNRDPPAMVDEPGSRDDRTMDSDPVIADLPRPTRSDAEWVDGIDVFEHHCIDFDRVVAQGVKVAIVRAGRGTRQDSRWIEHVTAAHRCGLAVASYWHVYPSRADAHRQAELFVAAIRSADVPFDSGHWADISSTDGFERGDLGRFVAAFLRRGDELLGDQIGVFATPGFWRRHVGFDDPGRPRWSDSEPGAPDIAAYASTAGVRLTASDRGGPGRHLVRPAPLTVPAASPPGLVVRGRTESVDHWRARWERGPEIAVLQIHLNELGARLVVDGVFGPQTDAAVRICDLLCRRDRLPWPFGSTVRESEGVAGQASSTASSRTRASSTSNAGRFNPPSGMITSA